jgi:NAD(P)-dependent dehydrogenase (short-subunit alcohol dehydrogenase family)
VTRSSVSNRESDSRVAVVSGGAGGIGTAIVSALEDSGHRTVIIDRMGTVPCDLGSEASTRAAAEAVLKMFGRCDVFVQCAATFDLAALNELDLVTWRRVMAVNVESALLLAQAFTPGMVERGFGRVIFVTSDTLWSPPAGEFLPYVASKAALIGVMRTLAVDLGQAGVSVSAVAPGLTDTPGSRTANSDADFETVVEHQALKRRLTAQDSASAVAYLASDGGAAMTGQVLCLDGGLILR